MDARTRGTIEMISAMAISGTVGWCVVQSGQAASSVVFWRCLFGAAVMALACLALGLLRGLKVTRRQCGWMLLGGVALAGNWLLLFSAYSQASIAVATVVYHTQPFMLLALGALLLGERITASGAGWLLLAFAGMLLIVTTKAGVVGEHYLLGVLLALAAAFFYAVVAIIVKQLKGVPPQLIVLVQLLVGALLLLPWAQMPAMAEAGSAWAYLVIIGAAHTGLMSTLLYSAIQKIPTALVGALSFIYPVVAIVVDRVAFGHALNVVQALGAVAILLAAWGMGRPPRAAASSASARKSINEHARGQSDPRSE